MVCFTVISFIFYFLSQGYTAFTGDSFSHNEKLLAREYMIKFAVFYDTVLVIFLVGFFIGKRNKRPDRHVV
uniref:Integral membrane protein n=1 Tax=Bird gammacoronavirus AnasCN24 TaxID=3237959 RepID=A0AB39ADQ6_9GAMC